MKKAIDIFRDKLGNSFTDYVGNDDVWLEDIVVSAMQKYAKIACKEQRKICSEHVDADLEPMGWLAEKHMDMPLQQGVDYEIGISRNSIIDAPEPKFK